MIKRVGVLTSGGDAPGMNAAIRAVTRTALFNGLDVVGIRRGYEGLLQSDFIPMTKSSVSGILMHGGTVLRTTRCPEFMRPEGVNAGVAKLRENDIDALVVIGGDGSFHGAKELADRGFPTVGVPATIDNDMAATDYTIGFDTACNTAIQCIEKLRDTASSHKRMFIVEVMGRNAGFLALEAGVSCGAEFVIVPEIPLDIDKMIEKLRYAVARGKTHFITVLAEGVMPASELAHRLKDEYSVDAKIVVLGYLQRGGAPSCFDIMLASKLGNASVKALMEGKSGVMTGHSTGKVILSPLESAWTEHRSLDPDLLVLAEVLSI